MESPEPDLLDRGTLITPEELAGYLNIPRGTIDQWASRGGGPEFHRFGRSRRYHPADVREWMKATKRARAGEKPPQPDAA